MLEERRDGFVFESIMLATAVASTSLAHACDPSLQVSVYADSLSAEMGRSVTLDVTVQDRAAVPAVNCLLLAVDPFSSWFGNVRRDELIAGRILPANAILSEPISVDVRRRTISPRRDPSHLVGMQWGSYIFPGGFYWQTAQAVPLTGFYDTYNPDVIRQHVLWFADMGVDFLMADWPVYIPPDAQGEQHWSDRNEFGIQQIHATTMMLEGLAVLRDEGLPAPAMVLMAFLANGPANTKDTLNEELQWLHDYFIRNPRFPRPLGRP